MVRTQLSGLKEWILCPPEDQHLFKEAGRVNTFNPDFSKYPEAKRARCARTLLYPGDVVYYPSNWWHETRNHGYPTVSLTGRIVTKHNYNVSISIYIWDLHFVSFTIFPRLGISIAERLSESSK